MEARKKSLEKVSAFLLNYGLVISSDIFEIIWEKHNLQKGCEDSYNTLRIEMILRIETGRHNNSYVVFDRVIDKFNLNQVWSNSPKWFGEGFNFEFCHIENRYQFNTNKKVHQILKESTFSLQDVDYFEGIMGNVVYEPYRLNKIFNSTEAMDILKKFIAKCYKDLEKELNTKEKEYLLTEKTKTLVDKVSIEVCG